MRARAGLRRATLAFAALAFLPGSPQAAERTLALEVANMTCALCPLTVSRALRAIDGVRDVAVDLENRRAVVRYEDTLARPEAIIAAPGDAGFPARRVE